MKPTLKPPPKKLMQKHHRHCRKIITLLHQNLQRTQCNRTSLIIKKKKKNAHTQNDENLHFNARWITEKHSCLLCADIDLRNQRSTKKKKKEEGKFER